MPLQRLHAAVRHLFLGRDRAVAGAVELFVPHNSFLGGAAQMQRHADPGRILAHRAFQHMIAENHLPQAERLLTGHIRATGREYVELLQD